MSNANKEDRNDRGSLRQVSGELSLEGRLSYEYDGNNGENENTLGLSSIIIRLNSTILCVFDAGLLRS